MNRKAQLRPTPTYTLNFVSLRSVVSPEDQDAGRKRYCGITKADALFDLGFEENVRAYLGENEDGKKRKATLVNYAIRETADKNPDLFPMLNTGVVVVARSATVDDKSRQVTLRDASVINGAQTVGELKNLFAEGPPLIGYPSVNFELIISDDEELIGEISISRNFQNRVADLSIFGRGGTFDELEQAMQQHDPAIRLRTKETDFSDEFIDTEKLIQALTAMMPSTIEVPSADQRRARTPETIYRVYAYRHRSRCLKDFAKIMNDTDGWPDAHRYFLDVAWDGWEKYKTLKSEQSFSILRRVEGEKVGGRKLVTQDGVPDGIVFPMLSALSQFVSRRKGHWSLAVPDRFPWNTLFEHVRVLYKNTADHNPNVMGKSADCYVGLHGLCDMFFAVTRKRGGATAHD